MNNTKSQLELINALALSLLSLSDAYELPEAVNNVIQDINNQAENLISVV